MSRKRFGKERIDKKVKKLNKCLRTEASTVFNNEIWIEKYVSVFWDVNINKKEIKILFNKKILLEY